MRRRRRRGKQEERKIGRSRPLHQLDGEAEEKKSIERFTGSTVPSMVHRITQVAKDPASTDTLTEEEKIADGTKRKEKEEIRHRRRGVA